MCAWVQKEATNDLLLDYHRLSDKKAPDCKPSSTLGKVRGLTRHQRYCSVLTPDNRLDAQAARAQLLHVEMLRQLVGSQHVSQATPPFAFKDIVMHMPVDCYVFVRCAAAA